MIASVFGQYSLCPHSSLLCLGWSGPWVLLPLFPPKPSLCFLPSLTPGSAIGTLLTFQPCSLRFLPLHQLETVSAFLPFVRSSINLGDFITHLCLLVLDCFSGAILHVTSVIHFPTMLWIWPSARIIPLSLGGII